MTATSLVAALQRAVSAEQAIVFGYGVAGAHLPDGDQAAVTAAWDAHRTRRDALAALLAQAGGTVPVPRTAYAMPFAVHDAGTARRLIAHLEAGGAGAAWDVTAAATAASPARSLAVAWLSASAVDTVRLAGAVPPALPGSPPA